MRYSLGFGSPTPAVTRFLIIIIAVYLVFALFGHNTTGLQIYRALVLSPVDTIYSFQIWRLLTYGFLHDAGSPMHVIFNALLLYMLGPQLEERFGERRFVAFILTAIGLGGVFVCGSFLFGLSSAWVVGFSAATVGLVIAWGITFSSYQIYFLGIVPITGRQLVYLTVGLEIIYAVSTNSIASSAHFGGILAGFLFTVGFFKPRRLRQMWYQFRLKRKS